MIAKGGRAGRRRGRRTHHCPATAIVLNFVPESEGRGDAAHTHTGKHAGSAKGVTIRGRGTERAHAAGSTSSAVGMWGHCILPATVRRRHSPTAAAARRKRATAERVAKQALVCRETFGLFQCLPSRPVCFPSPPSSLYRLVSVPLCMRACHPCCPPSLAPLWCFLYVMPCCHVCGATGPLCASSARTYPLCILTGSYMLWSCGGVAACTSWCVFSVIRPVFPASVRVHFSAPLCAACLPAFSSYVPGDLRAHSVCSTSATPAVPQSVIPSRWQRGR